MHSLKPPLDAAWGAVIITAILVGTTLNHIIWGTYGEVLRIQRNEIHLTVRRRPKQPSISSERQAKIESIRRWLESRRSPYSDIPQVFLEWEERTGTDTKLVLAIGWVEQGRHPFFNNSWGLSVGTSPLCIPKGRYCAFETRTDGLQAIYEFLANRGWRYANIDHWAKTYCACDVSHWLGGVRSTYGSMDW